MKNRIIAFYDVLLFSAICVPLMMCSIIIFIFGKLHELKWILNYWYLVVLFAVGIAVPIGCSLLLRYTSVNNKSNIYFHYFPFTTTWKKAANNIDIRWNQHILASEVTDVEIVKLTEEEKQTKVYYKHWFNKYLKISLKYGKLKYVYIGNYSNIQIQKIINILLKSLTKNLLNLLTG